MKRDPSLSGKVAKNLGNHAEWLHAENKRFLGELLNSSPPAGSS